MIKLWIETGEGGAGIGWDGHHQTVPGPHPEPHQDTHRDAQGEIYYKTILINAIYVTSLLIFFYGQKFLPITSFLSVATLRALRSPIKTMYHAL